jgi:hypothetical protein
MLFVHPVLVVIIGKAKEGDERLPCLALTDSQKNIHTLRLIIDSALVGSRFV